LHHAKLKLCFWLMHMFEIFKFEFVVWLDLNSIEKIKRKGIRRFRIKYRKQPKPPSLGLSAQPARAHARALSMRSGSHLSAPPHSRALLLPHLPLPVGPTYRRQPPQSRLLPPLPASWAQFVSAVSLPPPRAPKSLHHGPALSAPSSPQES
jgi:hypothetical protein